jgi:predicted ABC-type transport system involved in lysophospholipase L1 biosynthesis ATPase subunit
MKVEVSRGKATWSLSAVIAVLTLILATGGAVFWAFAQTTANTDHRVILQRQQIDEDAILKLQELTTTLTFNGVDMMKNMSALQAQNVQIIALLKGEYTR